MSHPMSLPEGSSNKSHPMSLSPCAPWCFVNFVRREALDVMCGELQMTGVLVATKDKQGPGPGPSACDGHRWLMHR